MSRLTAKQRKALPNSAFAGAARSFPIQDRSHAANAKARAKQQLDAGKISKAQYDAIVAKANKALGKGKRSLSEALGG